MSAINEAYASNTETPIQTVEFKHSSLFGGSLRLVSLRTDITLTDEDSTTSTFTKSGLNISRATENTDGRQDLSISVSNVDNSVFTQILAAVDANRTSDEPIYAVYREFLPSVTTSPALYYTFTVMSTSANRMAVNFTARYAPMQDSIFPRKRYYIKDYLGLRYFG